MSDRYIASGSSTFSPSPNAAGGTGRRGDQVDVREGRLELATQPLENATRPPVIGLGVARGQGERAEHDAAFDLGPESRAPAADVHPEQVLGRGIPQPVAHAVEARQVRAGFAVREHVVDRDRRVEARQRNLDEIGAERLQDSERCVPVGEHVRGQALGPDLADHADAQTGDAVLDPVEILRHRKRGRRGVARVGPGHDAERQRRIAHRARQRADLIERGTERHQAVARDRARRSA
jgi:hypothetical protein